jgi:hypothetical protein
MFLVSTARAVYFSDPSLTDFIIKHEVTDKSQATEYEDHGNAFFSVPGIHHFCRVRFSPQNFVL